MACTVACLHILQTGNVYLAALTYWSQKIEPEDRHLGSHANVHGQHLVRLWPSLHISCC